MTSAPHKPSLPVRVPPIWDESLLSLAIRHAPANLYPSPTWIGDLCGRNLLGLLTDPAALDRFGEATGLPQAEVRRRSYVQIAPAGDALIQFGPLRNFWGHSICEGFIDRTRVWLCPDCYRESGYLRAVWALTLYRVCHIHKRFLIWRCPEKKCQTPVDFRSNRLDLCKCGAQFRASAIPLASESIADFSALVYSRIHPRSHVASQVRLPKELDGVDLNDVLIFLALLFAQYRGLGTVHGFTGILDSIRQCEPAQFAETVREALERMDEWPRRLDEYIDTCLQAVTPKVEIVERTRSALRPWLTWELPQSLSLLAERVERGIVRRREKLLRSVLAEEYQQGDEHTHIPLADAATMLGIKEREAFSLLGAYALIGRVPPRNRRSQLIVVNGEQVESILSDLRRRAMKRFPEDFAEVVNFSEARLITNLSRLDGISLLSALRDGTIRFLRASDIPVSLGTLRINYLDMWRWCQNEGKLASDEWVSFASAASLALLDQQTLHYLCARGLIDATGTNGYPNERRVNIGSLFIFRSGHRVFARTVEGANIGRSTITSRLTASAVRPVAGPTTGGSTYIIALGDMEYVVKEPEVPC